MDSIFGNGKALGNFRFDRGSLDQYCSKQNQVT